MQRAIAYCGKARSFLYAHCLCGWCEGNYYRVCNELPGAEL